MASVLSKLGLKPMEAGLSLVTAYDNGTVLTKEDLALDMGAYRNDLAQALSNAFSLSIEAGYVTPIAAPRILGRALKQALAVASAAGYLEPGTIEHVLQRALTNATILNGKVEAAGSSGNA